jgi:hypothetical protein
MQTGTVFGGMRRVRLPQVRSGFNSLIFKALYVIRSLRKAGSRIA